MNSNQKITAEEFELKKINLMRKKIAKMQLGDIESFNDKEYEIITSSLENYYRNKMLNYLDSINDYYQIDFERKILNGETENFRQECKRANSYAKYLVNCSKQNLYCK